MIALALALAASVPSATPAQVIRRYYAAIDRRQYGTAYRCWSDNGRASGKSLHAFAAGFARTRSTRVSVGRPGPVEGAAGSLYVTVPVRVDARQTGGARRHFAGSYTLRRVNDVPGATPEQLQWRIASGRLKPVR